MRHLRSTRTLPCTKNPDRDLNPDKEYQKLLCYHYTIGVKVDGKWT